MKKYFTLVLFAALGLRTYACDVCGCSLGGFSQGIMPDYSSHFVGVRYNHATFYSSIDHSSINEGLEKSTDTYQRADLAIRYNINLRFKVNLNVPFLVNRMNGNHQTVQTSGMGDPMILFYYQFLSEKWIQKNHFLTLGGGLKLPFGHAGFEDNGQLVNRNFQLGTGSVDFIMNGNYFYRKNKSGFMAEASYKINTVNKADYRFGNQFNMAANYVFITGKNKFNFLSFCGVYAEQAARHTEKKLPVLNTGGSALFVNAGVQYYYGKWRLGAGFQYPVIQHYQTDNLTSILTKPRFSADLIFFIGKK